MARVRPIWLYKLALNRSLDYSDEVLILIALISKFQTIYQIYTQKAMALPSN